MALPLQVSKDDDEESLEEKEITKATKFGKKKLHGYGVNDRAFWSFLLPHCQITSKCCPKLRIFFTTV